MDRDRRVHRAGSCHVSSEFQEIWVRDDSVGDIDSEVVAGFTDASLRHENEIPSTIIGRSRLCGGYQAYEAKGRNYQE